MPRLERFPPKWLAGNASASSLCLAIRTIGAGAPIFQPERSWDVFPWAEYGHVRATPRMNSLDFDFPVSIDVRILPVRSNHIAE